MTVAPADSRTVRQLKQLVAGAVSGAITKTAVAPLERVKILFQVQGMSEEMRHNPKYKGIWQSLRVVTQEEGTRGLFRGNGANVLRVIPVYALKFSFNDTFKDMVRKPGQTSLGVNQLVLAGTTAGLFQQLITYPLEVVRTRLSLGYYSGITDCFVNSIKAEGMSSMYKGIGPTIISGAPYVGLQMTSYDLLREQWRKPQSRTESVMISLTAGALAGVFAQTLTYPGDTVRRRMQTNGIAGTAKVYRNSTHCVVMIWRQEGMVGLFKGLSTNVVRCIPGAGIQFVAYELLKTMMGI